MAKTKPKNETQILTIRFPVALVKKLDRYVKRFEKEFPGISFQRTDAVRLFVERGISGPMMPEPKPAKEPKPREIKPVKATPKKDVKDLRPINRKPKTGKPKPWKKR